MTNRIWGIALAIPCVWCPSLFLQTIAAPAPTPAINKDASRKDASTFIKELKPKNADELQNKLLELDQTIQKNPKIAKNYASRGDDYNTLGLHGRALSDYNKAVSLEPKNAHWYIGRAKVYFRLLQPKLAMDDLEMALKLGPGSAEIYRDQASGYQLLHDYEKSLAAANKAVTMAPKNAEGYVLRATSNAQLGNPADVVSDCTEALKLQPSRGVSDLYYMRGKAYAELHKKDLADSDMAKAAQLDR